MALKKTVEQASGVSGEYWKITSINVDKKRMQLVVTISLFKDKAAADSDKASLNRVGFTFPVVKDELDSDLFALGYEKIKAECNKENLSQMSPNRIGCANLKNSIDA